MNEYKNAVLLFFAVIFFGILLSLNGHAVSKYFDSNGYSITTANADGTCFGMRIKFNLTSNMNLTGMAQSASSTSTNGYFYNGSVYGDNAAHTTCNIAGFEANISFVGTDAKIPSGLVVHNGEIWTFMTDAKGASRNAAYSGSIPGNKTGNSTYVIYDCAIYTTCNSANMFVTQGVYLETLPAAPVTPSLTASSVAYNTSVRLFPVTFTATLDSSPGNLTNYTFAYDNGSGFVNDTTNTTNAAELNITIVKTLPALGTTVRYQWFFSNSTFTNSTSIQTFVTSVTPNLTGNLTKHIGDVSATFEVSSLIEGSIIHHWYRFGGVDATAVIKYINGTDPFNLSIANAVTLSGIPQGFLFPYLINVTGKYVLFAENSSDDQIYRFENNDSSHIAFHEVCGGAVTTVDGNQKVNTGVDYNPDTGTWDGLIEERRVGGFRLIHYNSTNGCNFTRQELYWNDGGNAWTKYINHTWISYYGNTTSGPWRISRASGSSIMSMVVHESNIFVNAPGNEGGVDTDPDIFIVPSTSQQYFAEKFYLYYSADQVNNYAAYDRDNRSFYEVENVTAGNTNNAPVMRTITLSVTGDNATFNLYANATDTDLNALTYKYVLYYNNSNFSQGTSSSFNQSILSLVNSFANVGAGWYNATVYANDGTVNNSNASQPYWSNSIFVTYPVNHAPVINNITLNVTSDNITFYLYANATDPELDPITYYYAIFLNNSVLTSGGIGGFNNSILSLVWTFNDSGEGYYNASIIASDGILNNSNASGTYWSNTVRVTYPVTASNSSNSTGTSTIIIDASPSLIMLVLFIALLFFAIITINTLPYLLIISGMYNVVYGITLFSTSTVLGLVVLIPFGIGLSFLGGYIAFGRA